MFNPGDWPLPDPAMIWQFSEALGLALVAHADTFPLTSQYFYMPQTGKLDALGEEIRAGRAGRFRALRRPPSIGRGRLSSAESTRRQRHSRRTRRAPIGNTLTLD